MQQKGDALKSLMEKFGAQDLDDYNLRNYITNKYHNGPRGKWKFKVDSTKVGLLHQPEKIPEFVSSHPLSLEYPDTTLMNCLHKPSNIPSNPAGKSKKQSPLSRFMRWASNNWPTDAQ